MLTSLALILTPLALMLTSLMVLTSFWYHGGELKPPAEGGGGPPEALDHLLWPHRSQEEVRGSSGP